MSRTARAAILQRVRQALKNPSPEPHWLTEPTGAGPVFPLPEPTEEALRGRFREEFQAIQGEWHEVDSLDAARQWLADWLERERVGSLLAPRSAALESLLGDRDLVRWVDASVESTKGWDKIDVGVTLAESLVAESGTIAVGSGIAGRAISVLPPIHLVVATADQLVADLETSMRRIRERYPERLPTTFSWITGPSRTADIEKILVLGAHGPRRLVLLLAPAGAFH
jgi:L-lactate dehydrogenase complex protein LldG